MLDDDTAEYARWNAAAYRAAGVPDEDISPRTVHALRSIGVVVALCVALGVALALLRAGEDSTGISSAQRLVEQFAFTTLAFLVGVGGFLWARQSGHHLTGDQSLSRLLTRADRRQARRWIGGQQHPDPRWLPTLVALARQNQRTILGAAPTYAAVMLLEVSVAISTDVVAIRIFALLAVLLFAAVGVTSVIDFRRAGRFIAAHRLPHRP
ncbi:hypothetical protein [Mycetocola zhadangensis]|uniref:Uncharacterized protein n=1 Tax=Mycetocola zhadangensis TaxID=1164595 RepID=A0A3L7J7A6_9MICO|nr:hypothetical protein [Mycetocola zhadangensis]RLQ84392.1 hypothetical protein D9V28_09355 [Mycetocola zhadangensis]GGE93364.1 hypothetical protein GCM10011313_15530 [Mycetocola zhadangensis]